MAGTILTTIGLSKLAAATPQNQLNITHIAVSDGNGGFPTLNPNANALTNEVWRSTASNPIKDGANSNYVYFETNIPPEVGPFDVREIACFDIDGDMIAIGHTSLIQKPNPVDDARFAVAVKIFIALENASDFDLIYQNAEVTSHNSLIDRNDEGAHTASSVDDDGGTNVQEYLSKNRNNKEAIEAIYKAQGYNDVFFFADSFTYTESNDVGIYEDGTAWTYADAGALPVTIAAGTVPSEGTYTKVALKSISVSTVQDMLGVASSFFKSVQVISYHDGWAALVGASSGGGTYNYNPLLSKLSHDGGSVIDPSATYPSDWTNKTQREAWFSSSNAGSGCWVLQNNKPEPENYGAKGNNYSFDTESVRGWWTSINSALSASGSYDIYETDEMIHECISGFKATLTNATFSTKEKIGALFVVDNIADGGHVISVQGGFVIGANNVGLPLEISSSTNSTTRKIKVSGFGSENVFAHDGIFNSSPASIAISASSKSVTINKAQAKGVNRDFSDKAIIASRGIAVTNIVGICEIDGVTVEDVGSPDGLDSDGVVLFSKNRLLAEKQKINNTITNSILKNCSGRFIKLQTTQTLVSNNKLYSESGSIIEEFEAIDCQFGGNIIKNNFWDISGDVIGSASSRFVGVTILATGNEEYTTVVADNEINLERDIRYLCQMVINNKSGISKSKLILKGNVVNSGGGVLSGGVLRVASNDISLIEKIDLELRNNTYACSDNTLIVITGNSYATDSSTSDKLTVTAVGNTNAVDTVTVSRPSIVYIAGPDTIPYLTKLVCSGNNCGGAQPNAISAKDFDVDKIKAGNNFYFNSGTMLNAPSSFYDQNVTIESTGDSDRISYVNGKSIFRIRGFDWYESVGVLYPN